MDTLNTRKILKRKKFKIEGNNYSCVMCASHSEETAMHLIFLCPFAIRCWQQIGLQWQLRVPFFQMIGRAKQDFNQKFFMEVLISQLGKYRSKEMVSFLELHNQFHYLEKKFQRWMFQSSYQNERLSENSLFSMGQ
jgi:hypothetical protein